MIKDLLKKNKTIRDIIVKVGKKRRIFCVQKYGIKEIETIVTALNNEGLCSFVDFGTLLGLMREGHLLKHDADIDIGIVQESDNAIKKADSILESFGYTLYREFTVAGVIKEQSYMRNHIKIDLQLYTPEENTETMYCYLFYTPENDSKAKQWKSVIKKCPLVEKTRIIQIDNHRIFIPEKAEEILEYKYGSNWKVPDKSWVYWEGPNTYPVEENGFLKSVENGGL